MAKDPNLLLGTEKAPEQQEVQQVDSKLILPGSINPRHLAATTDQALGDLYYSDGSKFVRLPKGEDGQVLTMVNGVLAYVTPAIPSQVFTQLKNQAIAANTTYASGVTIQSGWSYFTGTGSSPLTKAITYPTAFTTLLVPPIIGLLGGKNGGGVPTAFTDMNLDWGVSQSLIAVSLTLSGFTAYNYISTLSSGTYNGFSWMAIGII